MEERKPLVSVIVPVYNVYPYLRDCVQSVQAQSYQNWELLLVDDGSTDGSGELCDELAVEDGRIRVFHKPNGGQSDARNVGLQQTQGKYFYLLDSDDLIRSTALAQFVERCEADGADAALTPLEMFSTEQPEGTGKRPCAGCCCIRVSGMGQAAFSSGGRFGEICSSPLESCTRTMR